MTQEQLLTINQNPNIMEALRLQWQPVLDKTKRIWSWTTENELAWLCEYATWCDHIIEIGSYVGKSAACMLLANPELRITSLDTWDDEGTLEECQFNLREFANRWTPIQGPSIGSLDLIRQGQIDLGRPSIDGAFIDGGHLYDDVRGDIAGVRELIHPVPNVGILIAGHDYRAKLPDDGVTKAVRSSFTEHGNPVESIWCALA